MVSVFSPLTEGVNKFLLSMNKENRSFYVLIWTSTLQSAYDFKSLQKFLNQQQFTCNISVATVTDCLFIGLVIW